MRSTDWNMRGAAYAWLVTGLMLLAAPTAAEAATASIQGDVIVIVDTEGDHDDINISAAGTVTNGRVWDISGVDAGAGCEPAGGGAFCDDGRFRNNGNGPTRSFDIDLGEGDDELDYGISDSSNGPSPAGTIKLGDGDDELESSATTGHTITAGPGDDTVELTGFAPRAPGSPPVSGDAPGPVTVDGGEGNDELDVSGRSTGDTITGGAGTDQVSYLSRLAATPVTVTLDSAANDGRQSPVEGDSVADDVEDLVGSPGPDTLTGDDGVETIDGGPGADTLNGGPDADVLTFETRGTAVTADLAAGTTSDGDTIASFTDLLGGGGGDTLTGDDAANRIEGGNGDDTLDGRLGADALVGGVGGGDGVTYESRPGPVAASLDVAGNDPDGDTYATIENLRGTGGNDTLRGSNAANRLSGLAGDDVLDGGSGDGVRDTLEGGPGARDRADYGARGDDGLLLIVLGSSSGEDTLSAVEDVTGSAGPDFIRGDASASILSGASGNDSIRGGLGADEMSGGPGNDELEYVDADRTAGVNVSLDTPGNDVDGDTFSGFERLMGSPLGDTLTGGSGPDSIEGLGGADVIRGGAGPDVLSGGFGNDLLDGGPGTDRDLFFGDPLDTDTVDYSARTTAVNVTLREADAPAVTIDGDELVHIRNVTGGSANDRLVGNSRNNVLIGGGGADRLDGKTGNDTLRGDAGNDLIGPLRAKPARVCQGGFCTTRHFVDNPPVDGTDTVDGGSGNDILSVVDGVRDNGVACGTGTDDLEVDLRDTAVNSSCEQVRQAPFDQHPALRIPGRTVRLDASGRVTVRLLCPRGVKGVCRGTLRLRQRGRTIGSASYRIARGRAARVRVEVRRARRGPVTASTRGKDAKRRDLKTVARLRLR